MSKKLTIIGTLITLAITGYFIYGVFATSNPHSWTNGLVGYWSFDGQYTTSTAGTRDVSGNGNWGAFNGGVKPVAGISGQALSFDGVDDYVKLGDISAITNLNKMSMEVWVKLNSVSSSYTIIGGRDSADQLGKGFFIQSATVFSAQTTGAGASVAGATTISANVWYHVVAVVDGQNLKIYLDGKLDGTTPSLTPTTDISFDKSYIGVGTALTGHTNGLIDEVRIYNRALSADEVKQHYEQTRRNLVINQPSGTPPIAWWKMDEATGAQVRDYSVNANNGTKYWMATSTDYGLADGKVGKALSFDGSDDYVRVSDANSLDLTIDFTMSAWIKFDSFSGDMVIISKSAGGSANTNYLFNVEGANSRLSQWIGSSLGNTIQYFSGAFAAGGWHYVVFTYENSLTLANKGKFYIDGVATVVTYTQVGTFTSPAANVQDVNIGTYNNGITSFFKGLIDDVRIYNYARTADQIAADYRAGAYRTIVGASVPSTWWTSGLVGYWNFDGPNTTSTNGTRDTSGNNNWGTFSGGVKPVGGISGQALSFDGSDDYVSVAHSGSISPSFALTLSAWVKTNNTSVYQMIFAKLRQATSPISGYLFNIDAGGTVSFQLRADNVCCQTLSTSETLATNTWYHLVATYDNETMKIYINGVLSVSMANSGDISSTQTLNIGRDVNTGTSGFMKGLIDEVRIYNRALGADEILQHYQQTRRNLGI